MKLKNHFLSLSALLAMGMATTAWGANCNGTTEFEDEVSNLVDDGQGGYYINMPAPSSTMCHSTRTTVTIPDGVKTFKVYDDGGADASFSNPKCGTNACSMNLILKAPDGYVLHMTGSLMSNPKYYNGEGRYAYLEVYDGGEADNDKIVRRKMGENHWITAWTGSTMYLSFYAAEFSGNNKEGLDLTVQVLKKNTGKSTAAIDVYDYGDGSSYSLAKINDIQSGVVTYSGSNNVNDIELGREFTINVASTIVLPFRLPPSATTNAKFYFLKKVAQKDNERAWKATMEWIGEGVVPEVNTPYAVIPDNNGVQFHLGNGSASYEQGKIVTQYDATDKWFFTGTYEYKAWPAGDPLVYAFNGSVENDIPKGKFVRIGEGASAAPMRAYISKINSSVRLSRPLAKGEVSSIESLPENIDVEFVDEGEKPMAIGRMNTVTGAIKIDRWFDLKGRSTNHKPTTKGAFFNKKGIAK